MACLAKKFTAAQRKKLSKILCVVHFLCAACGIAFFGLGIYIKIRLLAWMKLIDGYNDNLLPLMMLIVGTLLVVIDVAGSRLLSYAEKSARVRYLLIPYLAILLILCVCIFVAGIICFVHQGHLAQAFHRGLTHAMQRYKDDSVLKSKIDFVQIEFQCCGNLGYEDWFHLQWINNKYIDLEDAEIKSKMTDGSFLNDDVPFSCCDPEVTRHCIHHHIQDNDMHYNYDFKTDLTVFSDGCKGNLMDYYRFRLGNIGVIVMIMFALQTFLLIGTRYFQTAVHNAAKDPEEDSQGYLFDRFTADDMGVSGKKDGRAKARRDVETGDAEEESEGSALESGAGNESAAPDGSAGDSFDSDSFDSPEDVQADMEEPVYANLPFHEGKEQMLEAIQGIAEASEAPDAGSGKKSGQKDDSKASKKDSAKKDSSKKETSKSKSSKKEASTSSKKDSKKSSKKDTKKSSKKDSTKSPKKESGKTSKGSKVSKKDTKSKSVSKKKTSPSPKKKSVKSPKKKTSPSPKKKSVKSPKKKSVKRSPGKMKTRKAPKSMKAKSPRKSRGKSMKRSRMKNRNNNIMDDDFSSYSGESDSNGDENTYSDLSSSSSSDDDDLNTPLLGKFYSSSEEEELFQGSTEMSTGTGTADGYDNEPTSEEEVTWLLSRTQFYSRKPPKVVDLGFASK